MNNPDDFQRRQNSEIEQRSGEFPLPPVQRAHPREIEILQEGQDSLILILDSIIVSEEEDFILWRFLQDLQQQQNPDE